MKKERTKIKPKIAIVGLWHLGCVTAACSAKYFNVIGLDHNLELINSLSKGEAPIYEPGLKELLIKGLKSGKLSFSNDFAQTLSSVDILWVCYDTPVDNEDIADVNSVLVALKQVLRHLRMGSMVLISSQLPIGTCRNLELEFPQLQFACSPENLRLGKAIDIFSNAERVIVGTRDNKAHQLLEIIFRPFTKKIIFLKTESAEMVKHALNGFLATSITFINEIAKLCEAVGADAWEVAAGLKSDLRIGSKAYLSPGSAIAGGTLMRDVLMLGNIAKKNAKNLELITAIKKSNDEHQGWALSRLKHMFPKLKGRLVCLLGLTYKPNTDTLRRSSAIELAKNLKALGAIVTAFDPNIKKSVEASKCVTLCNSLVDAIKDADALVVCTECLEFLNEDFKQLIPLMKNPIIIDANRFLEKQLRINPEIVYFSVGKSCN